LTIDFATGFEEAIGPPIKLLRVSHAEEAADPRRPAQGISFGQRILHGARRLQTSPVIEEGCAQTSLEPMGSAHGPGCMIKAFRISQPSITDGAGFQHPDGFRKIFETSFDHRPFPNDIPPLRAASIPREKTIDAVPGPLRLAEPAQDPQARAGSKKHLPSVVIVPGEPIQTVRFPIMRERGGESAKASQRFGRVGVNLRPKGFRIGGDANHPQNFQSRPKATPLDGLFGPPETVYGIHG